MLLQWRGGSWKTAKILISRFGKESVQLLFTDTFIEDGDLYRFLIEAAQDMYDVDCSNLIEMTEHIPEVAHETMIQRKEYLLNLAELTRKRLPSFHWISDGREPWELFKQERYIGNSRIAPCSHKLKQDVAMKWMKSNHEPEECILYLGIDWTEEHRTKAPIENWKPYSVQFPLCEEPYYTKDEILVEISETLKVPRLYAMNFSHNNCGGFCVRAGQGHFINLLLNNPELYKYHEEKEQQMIEYLGKDISILRKTRNKKRFSYTLKQLREDYERKEEIDLDDIGGCGCFTVI